MDANKFSKKKLGFGLMRLPKIGNEIDVDQVSKMVDKFLEEGFTYFDTCFTYEGSEEAIRKALVERYDRDKYTLVSKIDVDCVNSEEETKAQFDISLKRTGVDYFDYYLLHSVTTDNYPKYEEYKIFDFVKEQKEKGLVKNYGFSFHADPKLLEEILTKHPDVDFVQLQLNYLDWEDPTVQSRANYEVVRKFNKPIVVMEPVKGGILANPPKEVQDIFKSINKDASFASWAIRFIASLEGIHVVLSGMSNEAQMLDNLSFMKDFKALNEEEKNAIMKAQEILKNYKK